VEVAKEAVMAVVSAADEVSDEVGKTVRNALLTAASLPRDVVEKVVKGSDK